MAFHRYSLTEDDVPMLVFDPANFETPFSEPGRHASANSNVDMRVDDGPLW